MCFKMSSVVYVYMSSIVLLLLVTKISGNQKQEKCAAVGAYCQNHWDCCSKSCHSYLMRCTSGQAIYPYAFFGINPIAPANAVPTTLDEILAINFGSGSHISDNKIQSTPNYERIVNNNVNTEEKFNVNSSEIRDNAQANNVQQRERRSLQEGNKEVIFKRNATDDCKMIPAKCYRHDECCTKRCHQFLHQCTT